MIVVQKLTLNVEKIILRCIFSVLLSDFRARGLRNIPTGEFFHADTETNVHQLPVTFSEINGK